ncbi:plexin domain-containing protein 1-like isoform X1 [Biomphalaria glabrata]|uniref:Plexin domain-containing protein 1-like isoform X1 n=1 Tax=Biomphalaria glabrata TaxID=6526 RepID=A0A9U8EJ84_BIOGL|nr:plexin domain-containing protein 1-like isoform X1 [Biomphalaria glabrata]
MAVNVQTIVILVLQVSVLFLSNSIATSKKINYQIVNSNELKLTSENYQVVKVLSHSRIRRQNSPADSSGPDKPVSSPDETSQAIVTGAFTAASGATAAPKDATTAVPPRVSDSNSTANASSTAAPVSSTTKTSTSTSTEPTAAPVDPFAEADHIHDQHIYYTSEVFKNKVNDYWQELSAVPRHETLSSGHRVAAVIPLKFKFHFYGHDVTNVTVATGGFIYMSPFLHQWLTATQYIAPLMANFDPSLSKESGIYYKNEDDKFTVEWKNVMLKDQNSSGVFTFQAILHKDDNIHFVYKTVPVAVRSISTEEHPVKIGLSDAYYNDTYLPEYKIKRRTIYEYHKVVVKMDAIANGTVVVLKPLPTCNRLTDCGTCVKHENVKFDCKWCNTIGRCSDGLDWYRQHWDKEGCQQSSGSSVDDCEPVTTTTVTNWSVSTTAVKLANSSSRLSLPVTTLSSFSDETSTDNVTNSSSQAKLLAGCGHVKDAAGCQFLPPPVKHLRDPLKMVVPLRESCENGKCNQKSDFPVAVIVVIVFIICGLLGAVGGWVYYAYTHPTSKSGMWLMEHRPSQIKANIKFWKSSTDAGTKYKVESEA